jgi:hypothetical protein
MCLCVYRTYGVFQKRPFISLYYFVSFYFERFMSGVHLSLRESNPCDNIDRGSARRLFFQILSFERCFFFSFFFFLYIYLFPAQFSSGILFL